MKKGLFEAADGGTLFLDKSSNSLPSASQALARVGRPGDSPGGRRARPASRCAGDWGVESRSGKGRPRKRIPAGSLLPAGDYCDLHSPVARPEGRHFAAGGLLHRPLQPPFKKSVRGISDESRRLLLTHSRPGNVRELKNTIERAMILEEEQFRRPACICRSLCRRPAGERCLREPPPPTTARPWPTAECFLGCTFPRAAHRSRKSNGR